MQRTFGTTLCVGLIWSISTFGSSGLLAQDQSFEALMAKCEKRTIMLGKDSKGQHIKAGERLDGYCEGFLLGSFAALLRSQKICLKDRDRPSPETLLSIAQIYWKEKPASKDATDGLQAAWARLFGC